MLMGVGPRSRRLINNIETRVSSYIKTKKLHINAWHDLRYIMLKLLRDMASYRAMDRCQTKYRRLTDTEQMNISQNMNKGR